MVSTAGLGRGIEGNGMGGEELVEGCEAGRTGRAGNGNILAAQKDFEEL